MRRLATASVIAGLLALVVLSIAAGPALAQNGTNGSQPVEEGAETPAFDVDCDELRCTFDARDARLANTTVESYAWDFGDGDTASGPVANHTFPQPGTYNVTLTLTGDDDREENRTRLVTVETVGRAQQGDIPWLGLGVGAIAFVGSILIARAT